MLPTAQDAESRPPPISGDLGRLLHPAGFLRDALGLLASFAGATPALSAVAQATFVQCYVFIQLAQAAFAQAATA
eukprot:598013-Alexandrium_andersonii.AAC.1